MFLKGLIAAAFESSESLHLLRLNGHSLHIIYAKGLHFIVLFNNYSQIFHAKWN